MTTRRKWLTVAALTAIVSAVLAPILAADIRLPAVIGDHMVIQQGTPINIWGWAAKNEQVTVRLAGAGRTVRASAADGRWLAVFDPLRAGGDALQLTVRGEKGPEVAVKDILVGEVWLCSGQSNMEFALEWLANTTPEIMKADHPRLRLFQVPKRTSDRPKDDVDAKWVLSTPDTARGFSAVAYFYGLELHEKLGVPVGVIQSAWGGTAIEPWTPPDGFAAVPETRPFLDKQLAKYEDYRRDLEKALPAWDMWLHDTQKALKAKGAIPAQPSNGDFPSNPYDDPQAPTTLYNAMIHALTPFAIRGAIWYQGEANRDDGLLYGKKMEALIRGWREVWKLGDFPFYYVQIAPFTYGYDKNMKGSPVLDAYRLPLLWEAQTNVLRLPATGMAVVSDIANLTDIHPSDKKDVAERLALWARATTYGEKGLVHSGPLFKSMTVEGDKARIAFDHVGGGLVTNDGQPPTWFEVAGDDRIFYRAEAAISGDTVVVSSPRVAAPKAVRLGWSQVAVPNLANREGLPASPFRTDRW
ncbi:MAG TPA: sialate O-acetylesterase [Terriglobales bacterium]|nr:sialate O-acetylesterase [Terriglobales bacterium]